MEAKTADDFIDQNEEIVVKEVYKTNVLVEKAQPANTTMG